MGNGLYSSGGSQNKASNMISEDGVLYNAANEQIGTIAGVFQDGSWTYYGQNGQEIMPDFANGEYINWEPCTASGEVVAPTVDPTIQCFTRDKVIDEPTNASASVAGKGYLDKRTYTVAQFPNEGNLGGSDSGFHSLVKLDTDGVPTVDGEKVDSNITTITSNSGAAQGSLTVWEGNLYSPIRYPDTSAGKYVSSAKLVNTYTATNQPDFEHLMVASAGGQYTLDRHDLKVVLNGSTSGERVLFELDPSQKGQWMRFAYSHGDKGGSAQTNVKMELTYEDGTTQTVAITNFIHKKGSLVSHAIVEQEILQFNNETSEWTLDGNVLTDVIPGARNMRSISCSRQPLTFNAYVQGSSVNFSNMFGGNQDTNSFEYSIDGGRTWQTSTNFDVSGLSAREILPMIKDSNGQKSSIKSVSEWFPCDAGSWSVDLITPANNDTSFDDGSNDRGWDTVYSKPLDNNNIEDANNPYGLVWTLDDTQNTNSYLLLGNTFTEPESSAEADLTPLVPSFKSGQTYTVATDIYDFYHGAPTTTTHFTMEVVDNVTGSVLGSRTIDYAGHTTSNLLNETFEFVGAGNPATLRFKTINDNLITGDWWGDTSNATLTSDSIVKTAANGWNTSIRSSTGGLVADGINLKFNKVGTNNAGMHGLDSNEATSSYADMDYGIYVFNNTSYSIYENGFSKYTGSYSGPNTEFQVDVATDGTVTYLVDGVVVYTSLTQALDKQDSKYWVSSHPYTKGRGIGNIQFNGNKPVEFPDATNNYIRLEHTRLFEGLYSDASHHVKISGNDIFMRGVYGVGQVVTDKHTYGDAVTIRPEMNLIRYTTWRDTIDRMVIEYQINEEAWVTMLDIDGQWDVAGELYLSPFTYGKNVDLESGDTIRYRISLYGDGENHGVYVRGISDNVIC